MGNSFVRDRYIHGSPKTIESSGRSTDYDACPCMMAVDMKAPRVLFILHRSLCFFDRQGRSIADAVR